MLSERYSATLGSSFLLAKQLEYSLLVVKTNYGPASTRSMLRYSEAEKEPSYHCTGAYGVSKLYTVFDYFGIRVSDALENGTWSLVGTMGV